MADSLKTVKPTRARIAAVIRDPWIILSLGLMAILLFLIFYPQLWIVKTSMSAETGKSLTLGNYGRFFTEYRFKTALVHSAVVSLLSLAGATLIAVPMAFILARYVIPGKQFILSLVTMSVMSPPFLGAYAWVILLGRLGILSQFLRKIGIPFGTIVGLPGIVWVISWVTYPLIFLVTYDAFCSLDPSMEEAGMSVGASRLRTNLNITLPLAMPGIITGAYMAAMAAFADFGTPVIIGGNYSVLPVLVYGEFLSEVGGSYAMASTGSVIMLVVSTLVLLLQRYYLSRREYSSVGAVRVQPRRLSPGKTVLALAGIMFVILISFVPHITVIITSFMKWQWGIVKPLFTLANYAKVWSEASKPIVISFFIAGVATLLDIVIGLFIAYIIVKKNYKGIAPGLNTLVMIPYIIPGTVLGIGFILIFNKPPVILTGTWAILCISYFVRKLPFAVKSIESSLYQVHPSLEEAAMSVGASSFRAFRDITAKLILQGIVSGGTMSFLMNITEVSSTIILYAAPWITMTIVIFTNAISAGSDFGLASAMTVVLMASVYIPLYVLNRLVRGRGGVQAVQTT
ncbi:MAG: iron ABC transporter permease [Firmicutes bacterium]|nr:iron ABC transporter permease [Bacillota bacterium]